MMEIITRKRALNRGKVCRIILRACFQISTSRVGRSATYISDVVTVQQRGEQSVNVRMTLEPDRLYLRQRLYVG